MGVTVIIGCGTGRCGTKSLASFLSVSEGVSVTHEQGPFLPWDPAEDDETEAVEFVEALVGKAQKHGCTHVGDVAANWLPYVPALRRAFDDLVTIGLWREKEEVVRSYIEHMPDACTENRTPGEKQFPTYDLPPKFAFERYWDLYQSRAKDFGIEMFHVSRLNERDGQAAILDHVGVREERRLYQTYHLNGHGPE